MSAYYSTQATIEARVKTLRVKMWGDHNEDGVIDTATLTQALTAAKCEILTYIGQRYGTTLTDTWTDSTRPDLIGMISDDITLYFLNAGSNVIHPIISKNHEDAVKRLEGLRDYVLSLPGVEFEGGTETTTARLTYLRREESDIDTFFEYADPMADYQYP
jgi:phage gp36-like protein